MELQDIQKFIEENKDNEDVQNYIKGFFTEDGVNSFLETDEGKKYLQPRLDKYHAKGLDTWKKNQLQKIIDEEVAKRNPAETEQEKQIRELQQKLKEVETDNLKKELTNKAIEVLTENKIPAKFASFLIGDSEDSTLANIDIIKEIWSKEVQNSVDERFKNVSTTVTKTSTIEPNTNLSPRDKIAMAYGNK